MRLRKSIRSGHMHTKSDGVLRIRLAQERLLLAAPGMYSSPSPAMLILLVVLLRFVQRRVDG